MTNEETLTISPNDKFFPDWEREFKKDFGNDNNFYNYLLENNWPEPQKHYSKPTELPDFHADFEHEFSNTDLPDIIHDYIEGNENWPKQPIGELLAPEQKKILERYNQLHLNLIPNDWQTEWQKLKDNQEKHTEKDLEHHKQEDLKPVNLPTDWEQQLTSVETLNDKIKRLESDKISLQQQISQLSSSSGPDKQVYLSLQNENNWLWETVELLNTGWLQYKLWLDSIENEKEADEAIVNLLEDTVLYWRTYLESDDPKIFEKMPVLDSRFSQHENRTKAFNLITLMTNVLRKKLTIDELLMKWHGGKTWIDYNKKYDFDSSLWAFTQLLYLKKKYQTEKLKSAINL